MALTNFFSINLPYGMKKNEKGEWMAFNREYKPIGFNKSKEFVIYEDYPIFTKFPGLTDARILKIANKVGERKTESGKMEICIFWFYNDRINPMNNGNWSSYWKKIEQISKYKRKTL